MREERGGERKKKKHQRTTPDCNAFVAIFHIFPSNKLKNKPMFDV